MATLNPKMWFVSIATLPDCADFTNWLNGKRKEFNDSMEFREWLDAYCALPVEFYLDGVIYNLSSRQEISAFLCGFDAALRLKLNNPVL